MHKTTLVVVATVTLSACSASGQNISLKQRLKNPLFAERYSEEVVEALTELKIQDNQLLEDPVLEKYIDNERDLWLTKAKDARKVQQSGIAGNLIPIEGFAVGEVMLLDSILYFGTEFEVLPSPSIHIYLTYALDPRDAEFPDETSVDLGMLQNPYGAQNIKVPKANKEKPYRTLVLWDTELKQLVAFAQLRGL